MAGHGTHIPEAPTDARQLDWFSKTDSPKPHVFEGLLTALELQNGFGLHTLNATARQSFEINSQRNPGAVLHCFLEGSTEASLAGQPMNLGRGPGAPLKLVLTSIDETQRFMRRSQPNEYVRKISIQMSQEWLDQNGLMLPPTGAGEPLLRLEWNADLQQTRILEKLAQTSSFAAPITRLQAEAMSLQLVAGCFDDLPGQRAGSDLTRRELSQLRRIEDFARQPGPLPTLQDMATEGGLSLSGLRRLIQKAHGRAPLSHARHIRLNLARAALERDQLSVEDAAELAGYGSSANFATAFRRTFGVVPSQVRRPGRSH